MYNFRAYYNCTDPLFHKGMLVFLISNTKNVRKEVNSDNLMISIRLGMLYRRNVTHCILKKLTSSMNHEIS